MTLLTSKLRPTNPAIESLGIIKGHYECNFLETSVPVLSQLLALEVVERHENEVIMKHPNTEWLLVVHESGAEVPDKPFRKRCRQSPPGTRSTRPLLGGAFVGARR